MTAVGEGCHAWIQPNGEWFESNAGLVVGDGESALIDTLADLALTRRMLDALRRPHGRRADPHAREHALRRRPRRRQPAARRRRDRLVAAERRADPAPGPGLVQGLRPARARACGWWGGCRCPVVGSLPLPVLPRVRLGSIGSYIGDMLEPFDFDGIDIPAPTREFEGELSLEVGGRKLRLIEVGPAHTPGRPDHPRAGRRRRVRGRHPVHRRDARHVGGARGQLDRRDRPAARTSTPTPTCPATGRCAGARRPRQVKRYWVWLEAAARHRFGLGMSAWEAARDIALSPEFRTHEWSEWSAARADRRQRAHARARAARRAGRRGVARAISSPSSRALRCSPTSSTSDRPLDPQLDDVGGRPVQVSERPGVEPRE